jgi:hypothetical protein
MRDKKRKAKRNTSHRLSEDARRLLAALAEKYGMSQTAILELVIREKAKSDGIS